MKKEYVSVINFFGEEWLDQNWDEYRKLKIKEETKSFSSKIVLKEITLHPLLVDIFNSQNIKNERFDFSLIKQGSPLDYHLSHLGRDLILLESEIKERGSHIKRDLLDSASYESNRFSLMIAAGYKIEGYKVQFVPTSSDKKRADLLVSCDKGEFYIENKRANQNESDRPRYEFFANLIEKTFPLLRLKHLNNLVIGIDAKGKINNHANIIDQAISKKVWRNQSFQKTSVLTIKFSTLDVGSELFLLLKRLGHFQLQPIYTRAEDFLVASDPESKNIILINKDLSPSELPNRVMTLLEDANDKIKEDKKLIVYFDIGRGMKEWNAVLSDYLYQTMSDNQDKSLSNIDAFVVCQSSLQHLGDVVQIHPNFSIIGHTTRLGGKPEDFDLFGFQGHTGMDNYLIKDFLNPVPFSTKPGEKYIECGNCGYILSGLSTNMQEGELISHVSMPCEQCGQGMNMILKVIEEPLST